MLNSLAFSLTVLTASAEGAADVVALMMAPLRLSFPLDFTLFGSFPRNCNLCMPAPPKR
jgi:hypothetical protein